MAQVELEEKLVKEEQKSLQLAKQEETTVAGQRLEQNKIEVSCPPFTGSPNILSWRLIMKYFQQSFCPFC